MKFIICGAGQVGSAIARYLAAGDNDVTVVDQSSVLAQTLGNNLDVQTVVGFASHPDVLERAGCADADMIIAVTQADEVNMIACQVAHSLFNVPTKIARVRNQSYLQPIWADLFSRDNMPIDVIISPEMEVARAINRRLHVPGAFDTILLADGKVRVVGVHCGDACPIINTPLRQLTVLFPNLNILIVAIIRDGRPIVPTSDDQMLPGDDVYFVVDNRHLRRALGAFGQEEPEARRIVIIGGGNVGLFVAQGIEAENSGVTAKIIEIDPERAKFAAQALRHTVVLNGDALDLEILTEANVGAAEAVVAVTNDDEVNILASLLAKRQGSKRVLTLVNKTTFDSLIPTLGIDAVVSPRAITVSTILQHVRRGRIRSVHSLREGFAEIIEADALETSGIVNKPLSEINLPAGIIIGAIVRDDEVMIPRPDTRIQVRDRVVLLATTDAVKVIEKMFSVGLEFF